MKVVAVVNNKGGVGKTTVTANLGAGLANRGLRVLLIDLDPQASLTKSFFTVEEANRFLTEVRTIAHWFESPDRGRAARLAGLIVSPPRFNTLLRDGGWLELIPSDRRLIDANILIPKSVDRSGNVQPPRFLNLHRRLADDLLHDEFAKYDVVLIDCPPNFVLTTKMAVVASALLVIPVRPDFLSTEGMQDLGLALSRFTDEYNEHLRRGRGNARDLSPLSIDRASVLFTMVQLLRGAPIEVHGQFINEVRASRVPVFETVIRDRSTAFAAAGRHGVPTIMASGTPADVRDDLQDLVDELLKLLERV